MLNKLLRFGKRQLHTIVSREIIKPSSPTPSHSKTYNLSLFDQIATHSHSPVVAFYPNAGRSSHDTTLELKNSLSKTLTQYYPFAGRANKTSPKYVDCNDDGVEYIEASDDRSLADFLQRAEHEDLDPLFPDDLIWCDPHIRGDTEGVICPLGVQVNRFACGGVAVATTLFHKVGDARTMINFLSHWAAMTAGKDSSLMNPNIIRYEPRDIDFPEHTSDKSRVGCVTRSFLFPNKKLNDLKAKVIAMSMEAGQPITNPNPRADLTGPYQKLSSLPNPTRVEALTWLLQNRAIAAATANNSGTFKPSGMGLPMDMRGTLLEKLPQTTIGNLLFMIEFPTRNQSELAPHIAIGEMRKQKLGFQRVPDLETATEIFAQTSPETVSKMTKRLNDYYLYSSLCKLPVYDIDFGWGKPVKVTVGGTIKNLTFFIEAPDGNGIEALMCLKKEDMKILEKDPELLAFC